MVRVGGEEVPGVAKGVLRNGMDGNMARMRMSFFCTQRLRASMQLLKQKHTRQDMRVLHNCGKCAAYIILPPDALVEVAVLRKRNP